MAFGMLSTGVRPIAIEFGVGSLKALQVASGEDAQLVAAACIETPEELRADAAARLRFQAQALPTLLKNGGFRGKRAVCSIPAPQTLVQHMQVQNAEGVSLDQLVMARLQAQHNCNPANVVMRIFQAKGAARGGKAEVICVAVSREIVLQQVQALKACRLETVGVHSEHIALLRCFDRVMRRDADQNTVVMYLDIGIGSTKAVIAHGKELVFAKTIQIAGAVFDQTVARQLRCTAAQARVERMRMAGTMASAKPMGKEGVGVDNSSRARSTQAAASATMASRAPGESAGAETLLDRRSDEPAGADPTLADGDAAPPGADLQEPIELLTDEIGMCLRYHDSTFPDRRVERVVFVGGESHQMSLLRQIAQSLRVQARVADPLAHIGRNNKASVRGVDFGEPRPEWAVPVGLSFCPMDL